MVSYRPLDPVKGHCIPAAGIVDMAFPPSTSSARFQARANAAVVSTGIHTENDVKRIGRWIEFVFYHRAGGNGVRRDRAATLYSH